MATLPDFTNAYGQNYLEKYFHLFRRRISRVLQQIFSLYLARETMMLLPYPLFLLWECPLSLCRICLSEVSFAVSFVEFSDLSLQITADLPH